MAKIEVKATKRDQKGKGAARQLRREGQMPAIMYSEGSEAVKLSVEARSIEKVLNSKFGERSIIELDIEGGDKQLAMIRELQSKTMSPDLLHVDFIRISMDQKVQVMIPVEMVNLDEVKKVGGVTQQNMSEVYVECLPDSIPESIPVDMGGKEIGDSMTIGDIVPPEGVILLHEAEETIASILAPRMLAEDEEGEEGLEGEEGAEGEEGTEEGEKAEETEGE